MINFIHIPKAAGSSFLNLEGFNDHFTYCGHNKAESPSFAITRHPYDRLISAYVYLRRDGGGQNEMDLGYQKILLGYKDFKKFVFSLSSDSLTDKIIHLAPMFTFVCEGLDIKCNYLFKIEKIGEIDLFLATLGMPPLSSKVINTTHRNHYTHFLDREVMNEINKVYAKDFELFNYNMI